MTLRKIDDGLKVWPPVTIHGYEFYITPDPYHKGKIWVENPEGEGMQLPESEIPFPFRDYKRHKSVSKEDLDKWWRDKF